MVRFQSQQRSFGRPRGQALPVSRTIRRVCVPVDLAWNTPDQDARPIEWKVRVILEPLDLSKPSPRYRTQHVFGMVGAVPVEGRAARAFLFDGNHDGVYTATYGDGMFVDLDGDSLFKIDQMSPEFLPFTVPFQLG